MERTKALVVKREGEGFHILASDESIDRDGERIASDAWQLGSFQENPVLLWAHDYSKPPIGRVNSTAVTSKGLEADITFASTPFAQEIKTLYEEGVMSAFSVGFLANKSEPKDGIPTYTDVELLEISSVPVPANRAARVMSAMKSALPEAYEGEDLITYQSRLMDEGYTFGDLEDVLFDAQEDFRHMQEEVEDLLVQLRSFDDRAWELHRSRKIGEFPEDLKPRVER